MPKFLIYSKEPTPYRMKRSLKGLLLAGISAEILIFLICYSIQPNWAETFRYAARYSGRLSFAVFMIGFYLFAFGHPRPVKENKTLRNWLTLFAVVHLIHFGFLATNVYLNEIPIIPVRLSGGALAYLMIVGAPLLLHKMKLVWQLVYFYYVSAVMGITYLARARGNFEGAEPFWFHYLALGLIIGCALFFGYKILRAKKKPATK